VAARPTHHAGRQRSNSASSPFVIDELWPDGTMLSGHRGTRGDPSPPCGLRLLDGRIAGYVRGRHRPLKPTAAAGQIEQQRTDHCHKRRAERVAVRAGPERRLCWTRTFGRRHSSRRDREARCSGGVLKSLAEGRGWRSIKRYRAHPLNDTRLEMDTRSPCGVIGERDDGGPFEGRRVGCHLGFTIVRPLAMNHG
jgi:hypothetical protein